MFLGRVRFLEVYSWVGKEELYGVRGWFYSEDLVAFGLVASN